MKTNVLVVATQIPRNVNGGMESLTNMIEKMDGVSITFVTQNESHFTRRWRDRGFTVTLVPEMGQILQRRGVERMATLARCNRSIADRIRSSGAQAVHCNDLIALWSSTLGAHAINVPVLFSIRDTGGVTGAKWRWAARLSDRVVVNSKDMKAVIENSLDGILALPPIDCVYSPVDMSLFGTKDSPQRAALRKTRGIQEGEIAIGVVGALIPRKQQLELLNALRSNNSILQNARIFLLGDSDNSDDSYRNALRRAADVPELRTRICFPGFATDVASWYRALDLVLVTSKSEGMARCMIESIACGTPVVSFDVSSAREILEEGSCGLVVAQGDFSALFSAIGRILQDRKLYDQLGANGPEVAQRLFDPVKAATEYRLIYENLSERCR
jgi:glycosyltransferase involved in cell wall biosynthesis